MSDGTKASVPPLRFGVATSAFQIEGSLTADGRGRSVWEDFCAVPGNVESGADATGYEPRRSVTN
jgi:beta-glucosidase